MKIFTLLFAIFAVLFAPLSVAGDCIYVKDTISLGKIVKSCNLAVSKTPTNQRKQLFNTRNDCIAGVKKHTALVLQTLSINPGELNYCKKKYPEYSAAFSAVAMYGIYRNDYVGPALPF